MTDAARHVAVVDTSFWSIAVRIGLVRLVLEEFRLAVPAAVREEILQEDPRRPRTRADYQGVFLEIEPEVVRPPDPEPHPIAGLDAGEASVIACAQALGAIALINERGASASLQHLVSSPSTSHRLSFLSPQMVA